MSVGIFNVFSTLKDKPLQNRLSILIASAMANLRRMAWWWWIFSKGLPPSKSSVKELKSWVWTKMKAISYHSYTVTQHFLWLWFTLFAKSSCLVPCTAHTQLLRLDSEHPLHRAISVTLLLLLWMAQNLVCSRKQSNFGEKAQEWETGSISLPALSKPARAGGVCSTSTHKPCSACSFCSNTALEDARDSLKTKH